MAAAAKALLRWQFVADAVAVSAGIRHWLSQIARMEVFTCQIRDWSPPCRGRFQRAAALTEAGESRARIAGTVSSVTKR